MKIKKTEVFEIINERGFHARPASLFVQEACKFQADITVKSLATGDSVDGKSMISLLMLAAPQGVRLEVTAAGTDAEAALSSLGDLFRRGFDEE